MKKLIIALVLAMAMVMSLGTPVLAWGEVEVNLSDIDAPGEGYVGDKVTASGTVTITANADAWGSTQAESNAWHSVTAPGSTVVDNGSNSETDSDTGIPSCSSDASQVYNWSSTFTLTQAGDWTVSQSGDASAYWTSYFGLWSLSRSDSDLNSAILTALVKPVPKKVNRLYIVLPDDSKRFKRRGSTRYADIDFNDGTWRILIPARVQIWKINTSGEYCGAADRLKVDEGGNIISNIRCLNTDLYGEITVTRVD